MELSSAPPGAHEFPRLVRLQAGRHPGRADAVAPHPSPTQPDAAEAVDRRRIRLRLARGDREANANGALAVHAPATLRNAPQTTFPASPQARAGGGGAMTRGSMARRRNLLLSAQPVASGIRTRLGIAAPNTGLWCRSAFAHHTGVRSASLRLNSSARSRCITPAPPSSSSNAPCAASSPRSSMRTYSKFDASSLRCNAHSTP